MHFMLLLTLFEAVFFNIVLASFVLFEHGYYVDRGHLIPLNTSRSSTSSSILVHPLFDSHFIRSDSELQDCVRFYVHAVPLRQR